MKRALLAATIAATTLIAGSAVAQVRDWKEIRKPALRPLNIQQPKKIVLPNGMTVFLQEDHELPLVQGTAIIRGGSRDEPAAKAGLVSIYGQTWRTGGTKTRTGDQLDDYLEARAAKVETGGDIDSTAVSFDALKGDLDDVFNVFTDLLRNPEFREEKIALAKNQLNTGIARRNDDASGIATRESTRLVYGPDSPYGRLAEYYTVAAVTRQDLLDWHKRTVHPNNIILGITGDFDSKSMEARIRKAFGSWAAGPKHTDAQLSFNDPKPGVYFVEKGDVNQSNIRMVYLGVRRDNPDYYALEVMNEILGGGFSARLFSNIRSKRGLAYSVGGGVGSDYDHPGLFRISMGTKSESTAAAIDALHEEIRNMIANPGTPEELQRAKDAILNSYVFRFDSKEEVLDQQMALAFYGYPSDFITRYQGEIEKVSAADVARVAKKYLSPDKIALLVVGKGADFDRPLSSFGSVTNVDIAIPESAPAAAPAKGTQAAPAGGSTQAAASDAGRALARRVAAAVGGEARIKAIKTVQMDASMNAVTPQGEMNITSKFLQDYTAGRGLQQMTTPMGEVTLVITPDRSFMRSPMGLRDMPASQKDAMGKELLRDVISILQHVEDPAYQFTDAGAGKAGDADAQILDINAAGAETRWYIDPKTAVILRTENRTMSPQGPAVQATDFDDWRTIEGVRMPFKRTVTLNGQPSATIIVNDIAFNTTIPAETWAAPAAPAQ